MLTGALAGGQMIGRAARAAAAKIAAGATDDDGFLATRIALAEAYVGQILPRVAAEWETIRAGSRAVLAIDPARL